MNYNDYPILKNEEYNILKQHFSTSQQLDRKTILIKICNEIISCKNICLTLENLYNSKIKKSVENTFIILTKLYDNFSSTFNINLKSNNSTQSFNVFKLIKKLTNLISLLIIWQQQENKEYYKIFSKNSIFDIIKTLEEIFNSLENSNIYFFKHM